MGLQTFERFLLFFGHIAVFENFTQLCFESCFLTCHLVGKGRRHDTCHDGCHTHAQKACDKALGSGIAGLAGCALSQIGNVGPDLGQSYIVDSFMVVVLGGVGQLAGTVYAALGLGLVNKLLEGWTGAVLAKIAVLVFIIVFIQKRPQGIFAMKGRSAEA